MDEQPQSESKRDVAICDYEGSNYRTDFWEGQEREYEDGAERRAIPRLLPPQGTRLLDIGAGFGRLANLYDGYDKVILLDYSFSQLQYARQRLGDERFIYVAADIYHLPLATNAVDTTVMVRVLHHLEQADLAFEQIARTIRGGGTYLLEFANKRHLKNILAYPFRRRVNPFDHAPYAFAELHYDFHPVWVDEHLRAAGFLPQERLSVSLFRSHALKKLLGVKALVSMDAALQRVTAPLALGPSIFCRSTVTKPDAQIAPLEALFRCPECGAEPLIREGDAMRCSHCSGEWPIEDGIFKFK